MQRQHGSILIVIALASLAFASPAWAAGKGAKTAMAASVRLGFSSEPDQLVGGGSLMFNNVGVPNLRIEPHLILGTGDNMTSIRLSCDVKYLFPINAAVAAYPLLGLTWQRFSVDCPAGVDNCSGSDEGLLLGGGAQYQRFLGELHIGVGDDFITDLTVTFGYIFGL